MAADADQLGIAVSTLDCGTRLIDCGVNAAGSIEAGRRLAEVCISGLGEVRVTPGGTAQSTTDEVHLRTESPVAACMASQYAGWEIKAEKYFAMGSGPMRAAAAREDLFDAIGHREQPDACVGVLETSKPPPDYVCADLANKCGVTTNRLTLLVARTSSAAGRVQIVARSVETALHKLHVLAFDLNRVVKASGFAPLPPKTNDDLVAIGWTNDAILYGSVVTLALDGNIDDIMNVGPRVPSSASSDYGRPFAEIFKKYDYDFYRIDPMLFSPAMVCFVSNSDRERAGLAFGHVAPEVLSESFAKK
jgi:methenyltetrahydromethanopterin cyclohydrolase